MFWDGKKRIGRSFPINRYSISLLESCIRMISIIPPFSDYFSVFGSLLEEDGMCLQSFTNLSDDCLKTVNQRKYIHVQLNCQKLWETSNHF